MLLKRTLMLRTLVITIEKLKYLNTTIWSYRLSREGNLATVKLSNLFTVLKLPCQLS